MRPRVRILMGAIALLVSACGSAPVELGPIQRGPDFIPHLVMDPESGNVFGEGIAIAGARLTLRVLRNDTLARIPDATVSVSGPTPAFGKTVQDLDLTLQPLAEGTYSLRVEAPGLATLKWGPFTLPTRGHATAELKLVAAGGAVTGRALGPAGEPLVGARVQAQEAYSFTDSDGRYRLDGLTPGSVTLRLQKSGYAPGARTVTLGTDAVDAGTTTMPTAAIRVRFDNASQAFAGTTVGNALLNARQAMSPAVDVTSTADAPDVRVIACPSADWAGDLAARRQELSDWVGAGGKLLLMGEWGGYGGYDPRVLNAIAEPYGLAFSSDLVRAGTDTQQPAWLTIGAVEGILPRAETMPNGVRLFESCSVFAPPPAVRVLSTGSGGFRIATLLSADWPLVVARPYGAGLVIALGDTSAWVAPATRTGLASNLDEASNAAFWRNLLRW